MGDEVSGVRSLSSANPRESLARSTSPYLFPSVFQFHSAVCHTSHSLSSLPPPASRSSSVHCVIRCKLKTKSTEKSLIGISDICTQTVKNPPLIRLYCTPLIYQDTFCANFSSMIAISDLAMLQQCQVQDSSTEWLLVKIN